MNLTSVRCILAGKGIRFRVNRKKVSSMKGSRIIALGLVIALGAISIFEFVFARTHGEQPKTVILIVLDTVGYQGVLAHKNQAPFMTSLADRSANFSRAFSTAPWTKPSIASILTARLPVGHGVQQPASRIAPHALTMAEYFSQHGFATAGFVSHIFLGPKTDYRRGFETYQRTKFVGHVHDSITSAQVTDMGLAWLKQSRREGEDAFLFLHYFDPHYNYKHHPAFSQTDWYSGKLSDSMKYGEFKERASSLSPDDLRYIRGLYGEEVLETDAELQRLFDGLSSLGLGKDLIVVVTGDHGEAFREHNHMGHGHYLYNELVHVPLVVFAPNLVTPQEIREPVSTMDVFPTLIDLLGMPKPAQSFDGLSFAPLLHESSQEPVARAPLFEVEYHNRRVGVVRWPWKIIFDRDSGQYEVFDLERDPREERNLSEATGEAPAVQDGKEQIRAYIAGGAMVAPQATLPPIEYSEKEVERLKTLGYMM